MALSAERRNELRSMPYEEYLQTSEWRSRRDRALSRAGWRCALCAAKTRLQVHHNYYDNLGEEADEDLTALCDQCHERHHLGDRFDQDLRVYLVAARSRVFKRSFASISDVAEDLKQTFAELQLPYDAQLITDVIARLKPDIDAQKAEVQVYLFTPRSYFHIGRNVSAPEAMRVIESAYKNIKTFPKVPTYAPEDETVRRIVDQAHSLVGQPNTQQKLIEIFQSSKDKDAELAKRVEDILDIDRYMRRIREREGYERSLNGEIIE
jgi:hypothetical protein